MPILTLDQAQLAFGHVALLDHTDFSLDAGERVALIGRNGTGKSSLLRIFAGESPLDDGTLWRAPGLRIAHVPQEPAYTPGQTVHAYIAEGVGALGQILIAYHKAALQLEHDHSDAAIEELHRLQHLLEAEDGWRVENRIEQVITRLALNPEQVVDTLSGGGLKRAALGRALAADPELLLLDEPTNHLDIDGILWLEELIRNFTGSIVLITHDRRFLDSVATRVIELDRGRLASFPGNYTTYRLRKQEMLEAEATHSAKFDKVLAQEEVWIRKGVEARRTRNEGRVRRLEQLRLERAARRERQGQVKISLDRGEASGKLVAEAENLTKYFGDKPIVVDFSTRIQRGDRIGFIGPNGTGKTTLIRLLLGELAPDSGVTRLGTKNTIAYFDQFRTALDEEATLSDVISPGSDFVQIGNKKQHVISYLEDFLFPPARARSPVKSLSGGERNRLLLARLFSQPSNLIILDEPTNDLDIETLELLEALMAEYDGTLFLVSHDRSFLDAVVTQVIASEGNGRWKEYVGGYTDWEAQRTRGDAKADKPSSPAASSTNFNATNKSAAAKADAAPVKRLSFKEQKELDGLPAKIEVLEARQAAMAAQLSDPEFYKREGAAALTALQIALSQLEGEIDQAMTRWTELDVRSTES